MDPFTQGYLEVLEKRASIYHNLMLPLHAIASRFTDNPRIGRALAGGAGGALAGSALGGLGTSMYNMFTDDPAQVEEDRVLKNMLIGAGAGGLGLGIAETTGLTNPLYEDKSLSPYNRYFDLGPSKKQLSLEEKLQLKNKYPIHPAKGDPSSPDIDIYSADPKTFTSVGGITTPGNIVINSGMKGSPRILKLIYPHEMRHAVDFESLPGVNIENIYKNVPKKLSRILESRGYAQNLVTGVGNNHTLPYTEAWNNAKGLPSLRRLRKSYKVPFTNTEIKALYDKAMSGIPWRNISDVLGAEGVRAGDYTNNPLLWSAAGLGVLGAGGGLSAGLYDEPTPEQQREEELRQYMLQQGIPV